ncbi:hypothetical protein LF1_26810 [Rubripirellula obstinata]|uniref:Uncharacterized protein n=1 Tax=Rubripirellula obstinata TaxID=406547 RepID=A0A5B1CIQ7_9BACT|nr:hypothetical protein LF1_26810 [Rubripirellula obstinata]
MTRAGAVKRKHVLVRLAAWASPRAFRCAWTRGAMPTRLNGLETFQGVASGWRGRPGRLREGPA